MIRFETIYDTLLRCHGPQSWWPAEDRFEIIVGALLVQRTTWQNARYAVGELRQSGLLDPQSLLAEDTDTIASCIRRAGFYRTKAARLKGLARFIAGQGGIEALDRDSTAVLRKRLLGLEGIGPETADAILLYAFERPAVVVDEYLRRLARRLTASRDPIPDESLREWVTAGFCGDVARLNELHALVVAHGKRFCRPVPQCEQCIARRHCRTVTESSNA